jgi:hypothetical protein
MTSENWIRDLMHELNPSLLIEYIQLWTLIEELPYSANDPGDDDIIWTRTTHGNYSARSAYSMQFDGSLESPFPGDIWQVWALSKCKVFIWLLLQE